MMQRNHFRNLMSLTIVAVASLSMTAGAQAALVGELGVLDPTSADGGINPQTGVAWAAGDQYRLAFYTSTTRNATSSNINDYNDFVQGVAAGSTTFSQLGNGTWKVLGSTSTVSARQNTNTDTNVAVPIYVMDGLTRIAVDSNDMWNGFTGSSGSNIRIPDANNNRAVRYSPYLNENGTGDSGGIHGFDIFTGSNSNGTIRTPLGGPNTNSGGTLISNRGASNANRSGRVFIRFDNTAQTSQLRFYALSDALTVQEAGGAVPEPATATLALLGLGGLMMRRRRNA